MPVPLIFFLYAPFRGDGSLVAACAQIACPFVLPDALAATIVAAPPMRTGWNRHRHTKIQ
ncbi:hypothetical protein COO20_15685 [Thalassospira marina]|uniref:Uncharacterized protein n=1 Tax=Thalassospira marina TaxID=2048283 RepID=A0A2N3KRC9_9PROT|nr:hypothetical protein COO20_15685 [Thalassospira marina]